MPSADRGREPPVAAVSIRYVEGYKYQLAADYTVDVAIKPEFPVKTDYLLLDNSGMLIIFRGYAWDGPSGPAIDTRNFMRGSLVHDALYQLMRLDLIPRSFKDVADRELQRICLEDGMSRLRAWWVYQGVKFGGSGATLGSGEPSVLIAP